jgi:hypothetical protein
MPSGCLQEGGPIEIKGEQPIGIHVFIEERAESAVVGSREVREQLMLLQGLFHQQRIDEHEAVLQELEGERRDLLLLPLIGSKDALSAVTEKVIGFIPAFDDIQARLYLMSQL